jgi:hypothetical protein
MPITNETLNNNLYDNLYSQGYNPDPLDSIGKESEIEDADVFRLKYKDADKVEKNCWMAIVDRELVLWADNGFINLPTFENFNKFWKKWAQQQTLGWKVTNRDRLVNDMKKRTAMKKKEDKLNEGYYALGKQRSYSDSVPTVKLIIQHTRQLEEGEQRFRNIAKIFVENAGGERFLLPTNRPGLARVFARHIAEGGTPYDDKGKHITSLVEEYTQMAGFVRATRNGQFNESALKLVNEGLLHYNNLRMTLQGMSSHRGYNKYFESYTPMLNEEADDDVSLNELFVEETLDPRIENVMPILKRLSKNITEMSEVKELEEWAKSITEIEDQTTKTLAVPADEMLEDLDGELDEGLGSKLLAGAALIATLWGINYKQAQEVYNNSPQLQKLEQLHTQAVEMGDKAKVKELERRIGDHKTRLDLGYGEVMGKGGVPKEVNEAPGAMSLKHNQDTEKSNLKAFDLAEEEPSDEPVDSMDENLADKVMKTARKKFKQSAVARAREHGYSIEEDEVEMEEGIVGNMINKAKGMFNKPAAAPAAPAKAAPVVPDAATKARIAAAPQGYDPNTGKPQVAMGLRPGVVKKGGTMDMTKKVVAPAAKPAAPAAGDPVDFSPQEIAQMNKDLVAMDPKSLAQAAARTDLGPTVTAAVKAEVARRKTAPAVAEDLDADQKRVGQLGPTEKVKNNNIGKLVGANESVEFKEGQDDLDAILRIVRK